MFFLLVKFCTNGKQKSNVKLLQNILLERCTKLPYFEKVWNQRIETIHPKRLAQKIKTMNFNQMWFILHVNDHQSNCFTKLTKNFGMVLFWAKIMYIYNVKSLNNIGKNFQCERLKWWYYGQMIKIIEVVSHKWKCGTKRYKRIFVWLDTNCRPFQLHSYHLYTTGFLI